MEDTGEVNLKRIAAALVGPCDMCSWAPSCNCQYCTRDHDDVILYRCPACHAPGSSEHHIVGLKEYFIGTADGTTYAAKCHWQHVVNGVMLGIVQLAELPLRQQTS